MPQYDAYLGETTIERATRLRGEGRKKAFDKRRDQLRKMGLTAEEANGVAAREFLPNDKFARVIKERRLYEREGEQRPEGGPPAPTPLEQALAAAPLDDIPAESDSLVDDVRWVNDNLGAMAPADFSKPPPSRAALNQLLTAQRNPDKFRREFILPLTKKESDADIIDVAAQRHDRDLDHTIGRLIVIAREAEAEAEAARPVGAP